MDGAKCENWGLGHKVPGTSNNWRQESASVRCNLEVVVCRTHRELFSELFSHPYWQYPLPHYWPHQDCFHPGLSQGDEQGRKGHGSRPTSLQRWAPFGALCPQPAW